MLFRLVLVWLWSSRLSCLVAKLKDGKLLIATTTAVSEERRSRRKRKDVKTSLRVQFRSDFPRVTWKVEVSFFFGSFPRDNRAV